MRKSNIPDKGEWSLFPASKLSLQNDYRKCVEQKGSEPRRLRAPEREEGHQHVQNWGGGDVIDCRTSHELLQSYSMLEAKIVILQLAMDCSCGTCFPSSFVSTLSVSLRVFTQFLYFN